MLFKKPTILFFKMAGAVLVIVTMGYCQFSTSRPMTIPNEMWAIITNITTHMFLSAYPSVEDKVKNYRNRGGDITKGLIMLSLLSMICASIMLGRSVGQEWWAGVGSAIAFVYGTKSS
jgi:hypothetical protein